MSIKKKLLEKLSAGTASKAELHLLFDLLSDNNVNADISREVNTDQINIQDINLDKEQSELILRNIHNKIKDLNPEQPLIQISKSKSKKIGRSIKLTWISRAATLLILITAGFAISKVLITKEVTVTTSITEMKTISLPDGSEVILNGNSQITYPSKWNDAEQRVVNLEGEAYFEVEKKPITNTKFQVKTNGLTIEVLGTKFNVKSSKDSILVYLEEGKVSVIQEEDPDDNIELEPGELIKYASNTKLISQPLSANPILHTSWKKGVLEFKKLPMTEIITRLNNESAIRINLQDGLVDSNKYSIAIPINKLEAAKAVIEKTTGHNVRIEGSYTLIISTQ